MASKEDNAPTIVNYYNKYFDKINGNKSANYRIFAHIKYLIVCNDSYYAIFDNNNELEEIFNSVKLVAISMESTIRFTFNGKELIVNFDTAYEDIKNQMQKKLLQRGRK